MCHNGVHFFGISTSEHGVFCTFWLRSVLRATTACTFSTSQLPKVLRTCGVFSFFTCKCASRHNGVQFFSSHLATWLRTRRFSEPTFRPSGATNHSKNTVFRNFPTFSGTWIFFLLRLSLFDLLSSSDHLCFSSVHIVGGLTSKLPSVIYSTSLEPVQLWKAGGLPVNLPVFANIFQSLLMLWPQLFGLPCL